ncbi:uncharacterized protein LOC130770907 isoform X2 [Actinidia eriantha]|uniref:uncharacterized protein LOC130770907 isoform X2 n=1 Tax=Actinidia eriantha TaxID=165200 RepID=UPI002591228F|nr:uncharacterized protein LOC130770907 isoform X2 [Actinidia eriantha]
MDKYLVPLASIEEAKPIKRPRWKRILLELNGKYEPKYRHDFSGRLMQSYSQMVVANVSSESPFSREGISSLEFDTKGIYLASVTTEGCLTVHDFETLYSQVNFEGPSGLKEDEAKHLLHIFRPDLDVVRWNLSNQDEVACTSRKSSKVFIYDIGYNSSNPVEILIRRPTNTLTNHHRGLSDIAFSSNDDSRVFASDIRGVIDGWDRRMSDLPCLELTTNSNQALNRIQLMEDDQIIFGACKSGFLYTWDLRGGRSSTAFQIHKKASYSPLKSVKLASLLEKIGSLKAQSNIVSKEIHSIDIDPSCTYQLAFHLYDGWSGVLDIHNFQVTHVHCPPPPWLDGECDFTNPSCLRKPSWLPTCSIYTVGAAYDNGIHLLDFYPDPSSPCHVDYNEDIQRDPGENNQHKQNRFVPLSEGVTVCAAHPLNGTIVAGTKRSSLLVISQKHHSVDAEETA